MSTTEQDRKILIQKVIDRIIKHKGSYIERLEALNAEFETADKIYNLPVKPLDPSLAIKKVA